MKPQMIIFDYGQTLIDEMRFDGIKGAEAVLDKCVKNPNHITAEEIQQLANEIDFECGRYNPKNPHLFVTEIHNHQFQNYLYEYFGLERMVSPLELETVFWDAYAPGVPTRNISTLLEFLKEHDIRTAVISNISFSGQALYNRINSLLPNNHFEFIIASSEYVFRKPHKKIFEIALKKAKLEAKDVWYCGDNVLCDIAGAQKANLSAVWYKGACRNSFLNPKEKYIEINDWLELINLLEEL